MPLIIVNRYNHDIRFVQELACRTHLMVYIEKITTGNKESKVSNNLLMKYNKTTKDFNFQVLI